jgi:hypothetical protein
MMAALLNSFADLIKEKVLRLDLPFRTPMSSLRGSAAAAKASNCSLVVARILFSSA